jgi:hypothetical protein
VAITTAGVLGELQVRSARRYRTSSGLIAVKVRQCPCGTELIQPVSEMLADHVLLEAEPVTEGRMVTLLLVGGKGTPSRLACRVLGPFEADDRLAKVDLFLEHSCGGQGVPIDLAADQPPRGARGHSP